MKELIWAIISAVFALVSLLISIMQFKETGFLFNNAYIWASKEEKKTMNKKPYYRQSAVAFSIIAAIFFFMALECFLMTVWLWLIVAVLSVVLILYLIVFSVK